MYRANALFLYPASPFFSLLSFRQVVFSV